MQVYDARLKNNAHHKPGTTKKNKNGKVARVNLVDQVQRKKKVSLVTYFKSGFEK